MLGHKSFAFWLWWRMCWFFISPCIIVVSRALHRGMVRHMTDSLYTCVNDSNLILKLMFECIKSPHVYCCLGDPSLVSDDIYTTLLWCSPVPSLGLGSGVVHDCVHPPLYPCHRCV